MAELRRCKLCKRDLLLTSVGNHMKTHLEWRVAEKRWAESNYRLALYPVDVLTKHLGYTTWDEYREARGQKRQIRVVPKETMLRNFDRFAGLP